VKGDDSTVNDGLAGTLRSLCEEHGLIAMYVFGSRADEIAALASGQAVRGAHPDSDVDIGVQPRRGHELSAAARVRLMQQLETLLDVPRVDLVILSEASAFLAADVVRGELLAATDLDAEADAQLYYLRRAADLAPFLREQWREKVGSEL
jgi:predicted nucleotidyltransferase